MSNISSLRPQTLPRPTSGANSPKTIINVDHIPLKTPEQVRSCLLHSHELTTPNRSESQTLHPSSGGVLQQIPQYHLCHRETSILLQ